MKKRKKKAVTSEKLNEKVSVKADSFVAALTSLARRANEAVKQRQLAKK